MADYIRSLAFLDVTLQDTCRFFPLLFFISGFPLSLMQTTHIYFFCSFICTVEIFVFRMGYQQGYKIRENRGIKFD